MVLCNQQIVFLFFAMYQVIAFPGPCFRGGGVRHTEKTSICQTIFSLISQIGEGDFNTPENEMFLYYDSAAST